MIKTNVELQRMMQNEQERENYQRQLFEYNHLRLWERLFTSAPEKPVAIDPQIKVGERFAIQYGQLSAPLHLENVVDSPGSYIHLLDYGPIGIDSRYDGMWTIVEYQGNNIFKDLLTGEYISKGLFVEDVYYSPGTAFLGEDDIEQLYEVPFGIHSDYLRASVYGNIGDVEITLTEITPEINQLIEEETIPVIDEIMNAIERQKSSNVRFINSWLTSYIRANEDMVRFISYNYPRRLKRQLNYIESLKRIREQQSHPAKVKK